MSLRISEKLRVTRSMWKRRSFPREQFSLSKGILAFPPIFLFYFFVLSCLSLFRAESSFRHDTFREFGFAAGFFNEANPPALARAFYRTHQAHSRNLERAAIKVRNKAIGEARPRSHDNCRLLGSGRAIHRKSHGCTVSARARG